MSLGTPQKFCYLCATVCNLCSIFFTHLACFTYLVQCTCSHVNEIECLVFLYFHTFVFSTKYLCICVARRVVGEDKCCFCKTRPTCRHPPSLTIYHALSWNLFKRYHNIFSHSDTWSYKKWYEYMSITSPSTLFNHLSRTELESYIKIS